MFAYSIHHVHKLNRSRQYVYHFTRYWQNNLKTGTHRAADIHLNITTHDFSLHCYCVPENTVVKQPKIASYLYVLYLFFPESIAYMWHTYSDPYWGNMTKVFNGFLFMKLISMIRETNTHIHHACTYMRISKICYFNFV